MKHTKYIIIAAIIILIGSVILPDLIYNSAYKAEIIQPQIKDISRTQALSGKIVSSDEQEIFAPTDCKIKRMLVKEGEYVKKGDKIAEIDIDSTKAMFLTNTPPDYDSIAKITRYITSPDNGRITSPAVTDNMPITAENAICSLIKTSGLTVTAAIDESKADKIKTGQTVYFTCTAAKKIYMGKIESISATAQTAANGENVLTAAIMINNADEQLKPGYTADITVDVGTVKNAVCLPQECIKSENGGEYIYIYSGGKAQKKHITADFYKDGYAIISSDIDKNSCVVSNIDSLHDDAVSVIAIYNNEAK